MTACLSAPLVPCFMTFSFCSGMRRNQNFETKFLDEKVTCVFRLFVFSTVFFFGLSFFSFSYLFSAMIDLPLGLLPVRKLIETGKFYHVVVTCSRRQLAPSF